MPSASSRSDGIPRAAQRRAASTHMRLGPMRRAAPALRNTAQGRPSTPRSSSGSVSTPDSAPAGRSSSNGISEIRRPSTSSSKLGRACGCAAAAAGQAIARRCAQPRLARRSTARSARRPPRARPRVVGARSSPRSRRPGAVVTATPSRSSAVDEPRVHRQPVTLEQQRAEGSRPVRSSFVRSSADRSASVWRLSRKPPASSSSTSGAGASRSEKKLSSSIWENALSWRTRFRVRAGVDHSTRPSIGAPAAAAA